MVLPPGEFSSTIMIPERCLSVTMAATFSRNVVNKNKHGYKRNIARTNAGD